MSTSRVSKGRQKINMEKITNERSLAVTFTKRHGGIFNKAMEISTLCKADIAIIILSPTNKPYSFGSPSVDAVLGRFMGQNPDHLTSVTSGIVENLRDARIKELNTKLSDLVEKLESEKETSKELKKTIKERQESCWLNAPIENMGLEELEHLKGRLLELKGSRAGSSRTPRGRRG